MLGALKSCEASMIIVVDYGMGNLRSVQKAFEKIGTNAVISRDPDTIRKADGLVLPGVGAFPECMKNLTRLNLVDPILEFISSGRPFLGICLGLQLLFDVGYENGMHEGLGILPGEVVRFEVPVELKVPHMGWNSLSIRRRPPLLEGLVDGTHVYFVHSYYVKPRDASVIATETDYGGQFCSMIWRGNLFATQFHPEKSQADGLKILRNFAAL